jgi:hypothetical protein
MEIIETMTRQRRRQEARKNAWDHVRVRYAGVGQAGNTAWPEGMPRRSARGIAHALARKHWRSGVDVSNGPVTNAL